MATYVIGDIHGCYKQLKLLLETINFDSKNDILWFTGDLINGGPQPAEVIRFIKSLGDKHICVLGNHDLVLLAVAAGQMTAPHDRDIGFEPVLEAADRDELLNWLRMRPMIHYDASFNTLLVHAGVLPQWTLTEIQQYAQEIENILRSTQACELYSQMYGNLPDTWSNTLTGWERLRFLINCFTRMRFCTDSGQLDLKAKGSAQDAPAGFKPWFELPTVRDSNLKILFGHWAALMGNTGVANALALDTGCVWGHTLTALRLDDSLYFSV
jgi:bis(5'-nucleosyl)-tetraphosphatase (symmetrical)